MILPLGKAEGPVIADRIGTGKHPKPKEQQGCREASISLCELEDGCHCRGPYDHHKELQLAWKLDGPEHKSRGIRSPRTGPRNLASRGKQTSQKPVRWKAV